MKQVVRQRGRRGRVITAIACLGGLLCVSIMIGGSSIALAQSVSSVRSFDGGVAPLFNSFGGLSHLYIDSQGTQGYIYTPGHNFESFSFLNPTTGQAWVGAVTTFGPQLSIGLIQGAVQSGTPVVLPGPPRQTGPLPSIQSTILDEIPF